MKILILDCNNLLYRTFWVSKNSIGDDSGPMLVHLFLNSVYSYVNQFKPNKIYAVWDKKLATNSVNFRKEILIDQYKATRDKSLTEDAHRYDDNLVEMLESLGIINFYPHKLEADDVISWLTTQENAKYTIVTVDKDLLQLVDSNVDVYSPIKRLLITSSNFSIVNNGIEKKYFLTLKAITGDNSDNIKGLYKVGPKKGIKLATEIVDNNNTNCLTDEQRVIFERNMHIMDLKTGYMVDEEYKHYINQMESIVDKRDYQRFLSCCNNLMLNKIVQNKHNWYKTFYEANKLNKLVEQLRLH